ncbi:hypothetical protein SAMN02910278_00306 [Peptostreptococcus sp. D1]|nr:hypothetical protein SAMN02910278_00306 [Peptostreptococcus sp. D1]
MLKYPLLEDMLAISAEEVGNLLCKCSKGYVGINKAKEIGTVTGVVAMKMTNIIFTVLRNQEIYVPNI